MWNFLDSTQPVVFFRIVFLPGPTASPLGSPLVLRLLLGQAYSLYNTLNPSRVRHYFFFPFSRKGNPLTFLSTASIRFTSHRWHQQREASHGLQAVPLLHFLRIGKTPLEKRIFAHGKPLPPLKRVRYRVSSGICACSSEKELLPKMISISWRHTAPLPKEGVSSCMLFGHMRKEKNI